MSLPPPPREAEPATCYRHPDRPTGRRCTRCGKPACSDCLVQAAVGSHCRDCAKAAQPDVRTRAKFWSARQPAMVTMALIAINALFFVYTIVLDPESLSGRLTEAQVQLGLNEQFLRLDGEWYRLVTSGFMHFGLIHIGFNMYLLYMLGQMLEPALGRVKFLLVYLAGLLGGSAGSLLLDQQTAISAGASGAVFGLMGLAFVGYYLNGANPLNTSIGSLLMINLVITFLIPRISIGGHLGGAAAGAAMALVVMAPRHRAFPAWTGFAAPIAVATLSVVVAVLAV